VGGSVAHGLARPDSDVDLMLVLDDAEAARRESATFADASLADYEHGYADVKIVSRSFLDDVAARGSEPARWAFQDAFVVWSRDDGIGTALAAAAAYPEHERDDKLRDFVAHAGIAAWYLDEATRHDDPYLRSYATSRLVLYAGRAVLALNRMLYPFHKWFLHELERAPAKPPGFVDDVRALLQEPAPAPARRMVDAVQEITGLHPTLSESAASFIRRTEWSWRLGGAPLDES
jgi:nucleotidyltransferase-like protein